MHPVVVEDKDRWQRCVDLAQFFLSDPDIENLGLAKVNHKTCRFVIARGWERHGVKPRPIEPSRRKDRLWIADQIEFLVLQLREI